VNLLDRVRIKSKSISEYYLFQKFGFPSCKEDKISKSVLKKYLPKHPIMIDCGAHDGADTIELEKILGGEIHAFEPVDDIYARLKRRTAVYPAIKCYQLALSDSNGKQSFYVSEGASDASSSLMEPQDHLVDHPDTKFTRKIEVQTQTLDSWAADNHIRKIDMLWLDMQGFEMQMLQASKTIFPTVAVIHTEVSMKETYKGVPTYNYFRSYLEDNGFNLVLSAIPDGWDMGNALFVRKPVQ
jgi:FkbM family methyltransferase